MKMNIIICLEFELTHYDVIIQHVNLSTMGIIPPPKKWLSDKLSHFLRGGIIQWNLLDL